METLRLTYEDNKDIACSYPADITGYSFTLLVSTISGFSLNAVITNAAEGQFAFPRSGFTLTEGRYEAVVVTTDPDLVEDTSDDFLIIISRRPQ